MFDAETVDVYKDTHAALFLIHPTHRESLEYVRAKCALVPKRVAILIILNFRSILVILFTYFILFNELENLIIFFYYILKFYFHFYFYFYFYFVSNSPNEYLL